MVWLVMMSTIVFDNMESVYCSTSYGHSAFAGLLMPFREADTCFVSIQTKTNAISWNPLEPMNFTAVSNANSCFTFTCFFFMEIPSFSRIAWLFSLSLVTTLLHSGAFVLGLGFLNNYLSFLVGRNWHLFFHLVLLMNQIWMGLEELLDGYVYYS